MHTYPLPYPLHIPFPAEDKGVNFSTPTHLHLITPPPVFFFLHLLTSYKFSYSLYLSFSSVK